MGKRRKSGNAVNASSFMGISQFLCMAALVLLGLTWILRLFEGITGWSGWRWIEFIQGLCVLGAIGFGAFPLAKRLGRVWTIIYWIIMIICLVALVLFGTNVI